MSKWILWSWFKHLEKNHLIFRVLVNKYEEMYIKYQYQYQIMLMLPIFLADAIAMVWQTEEPGPLDWWHTILWDIYASCL